MNKVSLKNFSLNLIILMSIFLIDRTSKFYILRLAEVENSVDIYVTPYLNLFLIWNKGIAFGLLSINESLIYNIITVIIGFIIIVILFMILKKNNIQRYFLISIAGGALGNFYDRHSSPNNLNYFVGAGRKFTPAEHSKPTTSNLDYPSDLLPNKFSTPYMFHSRLPAPILYPCPLRGTTDFPRPVAPLNLGAWDCGPQCAYLQPLAVSPWRSLVSAFAFRSMRPE